MNLNLLILDFDDTLFPTTFFRANGNKIDVEQANIIDGLVCNLITTYINRNYKVSIITNSHIDWFKIISSQHLPNFFTLTIRENITVMSARDMYCTLHTNYIKWKILAFQTYVYNQIFPVDNIKESTVQINNLHVLSIGDSLLDFIATEELKKSSIKNLINLTTKFIKLEENPGIDLVINQLKNTMLNIQIEYTGYVPILEKNEKDQYDLDYNDRLFEIPDIYPMFYEPPTFNFTEDALKNESFSELTYDSLASGGLNYNNSLPNEIPKMSPISLVNTSESMQIFFTNPTKLI